MSSSLRDSGFARRALLSAFPASPSPRFCSPDLLEGFSSKATCDCDSAHHRLADLAPAGSIRCLVTSVFGHCRDVSAVRFICITFARPRSLVVLSALAVRRAAVRPSASASNLRLLCSSNQTGSRPTLGFSAMSFSPDVRLHDPVTPQTRLIQHVRVETVPLHTRAQRSRVEGDPGQKRASSNQEWMKFMSQELRQQRALSQMRLRDLCRAI